MKLWARLIAWFKRTVYRHPPLPVFKPEAAPAPSPPIDAGELAPVIQLPVKRPRKPRREHDETQAHYYLGDLLEQLKTYFEDLEYLRRGDPEGAKIFEKFGCAVCNTNALISKDMEPFFFNQLPAQGCCYFGRHEEKTDKRTGEKILGVRFVYFQKQHQPVNVQSTNGVIYTIGGVWGFKKRHLFQVNVAVFPDQTVKVLKVIQPHRFTVGKGSRKNGGTYERSQVVRMEWGYPSWALDMVSDYNRFNDKSKSVDEYFARMFALLVNMVLRTEQDMNVRVKNDGKVASFAINMLRTPYFFADREKTVNENGNTERILHIVKPHTRTNQRGETKLIKAHWRGLRRFTWNGYDVSIGMPGAHFRPLMEYSAEAWLPEDLKRERNSDGIDGAKVAAIIDRAVTAQVRKKA